MKERLLELYDSGLSVRKAAKELGMPTSTAYKWINDEGIEPRGMQSTCIEYADRIITLAKNGYGIRAIARETGLDRNVVRTWLRKNNIQTQQASQTLSQEEVAKRIADYGFKYLGGYENYRSQITIYCYKCGTTFKRSNVFYKGHQAIKCSNCMSIETERKEIGKTCRIVLKAIEENKEKRLKQKLEVVKKLIRSINKLHDCPICGSRTNRKNNCFVCNKRVNNKIKEIRRRNKINNVLVDKDITVKGLFKRDKGICYICNQPADMNDYKRIDGFTVCGGNYPSIDHVIPLSKGGEHSWKNVKLAHRKCNWEKSDKTTV